MRFFRGDRPSGARNTAAENFLALLNIQISGGSNSTSTASSPLNDVSSLGGALPTVSYVLTPTVQLQDHS
jgi:hypothetical protein